MRGYNAEVTRLNAPKIATALEDMGADIVGMQETTAMSAMLGARDVMLQYRAATGWRDCEAAGARDSEFTGTAVRCCECTCDASSAYDEFHAW
jgi:endonuclease/exonuclease/phosphatase family metal-dependent hydrolase